MKLVVDVPGQAHRHHLSAAQAVGVQDGQSVGIKYCNVFDTWGFDSVARDLVRGVFSALNVIDVLSRHRREVERAPRAKDAPGRDSEAGVI